jgi:hypothetical protein
MAHTIETTASCGDYQAAKTAARAEITANGRTRLASQLTKTACDKLNECRMQAGMPPLSGVGR